MTCAPNEDSNQPAHPRSLISLRWPHEETMHPWLSKMHPVKILIRLYECTGWFESSSGAHVRRSVVWRWGSYNVGLQWKPLIHIVIFFFLISCTCFCTFIFLLCENFLLYNSIVKSLGFHRIFKTMVSCILIFCRISSNGLLLSNLIVSLR